MDEEDGSECRADLGFRPQKENVYNKLLPYADKLDEESAKLFEDIKTNLVKSVLAREMRPGCALWTSRLNKYMKIYGLKFSKEDHVALIRLFYNLLTIPNLEPTRINKFATTLNHLLKKRYLLSQDDLQLEWRPLYDLYKRLTDGGKCYVGMYKYSSTLESILDNLIRTCRIYFPPAVTQEILDEFRPKLCPLNSPEMTDAVEYLEVFLPIQVRPEQADVSYNLWFEEFMNLWEVCRNTNSWENQLARLMAKLASHNIGYINWTPYIPIMFDRFLRSIQLPVSYRKMVSGNQHKIDISVIALWIVCVLSGKEDIGFFYLEKFMQALESYYHPANTGRWTPRLCELLRKLSFCFVQRIYSERYKKPSWETQIPADSRLKDEDIDRFINILKPCVVQAVFSKLDNKDISHTLQYLASLRPNIIVPVVLEKLFASMDTLTEPHKLTWSMMGTVAVARYLVQGAKYNYPEGPTHVIPLLMALLPGIDPNDIRKCFTTFHLIVFFVNMVPLVDSSEACKYYDDLTEEEHIICEASARMEDFVLQFLDRILSWVESNSLEFTRLEQLTNDNNRKNRSEDLAESALISVINSVLNQCSSEIFTAALRKVYNFATGRILEIRISGKMVAIICQCFTRVNPKETMRLFVPYLCDTIEQMLGENDDVLKEEILNDELLYNMLLLTEMVEAGPVLVDYLDRLNQILERTLHMTSLKCSTMAAHMLELMMMSLTLTRPTEFRSCNRSYDTPLKDFLTIREWGAAVKMKELNISWYMPGEKEVSCVQSLLNRYLLPELDKLEKYAVGEVILSREDLRRSLRIVMAILAARTVLPQWDEPAVQLVDSVLEPWAFQLIVGGSQVVTMPDGRNVRKVIADTMHRVQKKLLEIDEGDTKCFHLIIHVYDILVFNRFRDFEMRWKQFHTLKKHLEDRLHQNKQHPRHLLIDRVVLHQEFRNESRSCSFTETHRQILLDLFELSVSRYGEVRVSSQAKLFAVVSYFPYSYTVLTPFLKESLQMNTCANHEKFKGCLYTLLGPKSSPIIARHDWSFVRDIWPLLVKSTPSEKPSIINLLNALMDALGRHFCTIAIEFSMPEKCLESARAFADMHPVVDLANFRGLIENGEETLRAVCNKKCLDYRETVDLLLDAAASENLHWRYHYMALYFISTLVHRDVKYSAKVARYFLSSLINDSINVRKIALKVVVYIFYQNKPVFAKLAIDPLGFNNVTPSKDQNYGKLKPGIRADNKWLLYNSQTAPKAALEWDKPRYVHPSYVGFYSWPKELKIYAPSWDQPSAAKRMHDLTEIEREIHCFFSDHDKINALIKYFALEERKGKDQFNHLRFLMYTNYFKVFEDVNLDLFVNHVKALIDDKQEASQRCASEIISGIIRGSKHWSFEKVNTMWSKLLPVMHKVFLSLSSETLTDWILCIKLALENRDPNRHHWLLEHLMEEPLAEQTTSFINCGRLYLLYTAVGLQSWRNAELINRLLGYLENYLAHPFENVRVKISACLMVIFSVDFILPNGNVTNCPRVEDFFRRIAPQLENLYEQSLSKLDDNRLETEDDSSPTVVKNDKDEALLLFKIVAKYMTMSIVRVTHVMVPEFLSVLPLVCILQSNEVDEELREICSSLLAVLSQSMLLDVHVPVALDAVQKVVDCPFWSARAVIAEVLPVMVFYNLSTFISQKQWVLRVQSIVLQLLEDVQPEVRISAGKILSGLLHCKFIPSPMELLEKFKLKAKTKLNKRDSSRLPIELTEAGGGVLRLRHAGVLGLCAFISSQPYDVPDYLPEVFGQLGPHLTDPQPIPATIRKTLGDFKRTHLDNWEVHKLKFTEEELSVLSDLTVPPSYYV